MKPSDYTRAILVDGVLTTVGGLLEANEEMPDILGDCKVAVAAVLNGADRYILGGGAAALTVISSAHGVRPCAHCNHPVVHCNRCEGWEHTEKDRSCFLSPAPCEDQQNVADIGAPCEKCGEPVPETEHVGNTRPDGTSEYLCPDCYVPHATPITTSENLTQRLLTASTILLDLHGWEACEEWGDEDKAMFQGCIDVVTDAAERTGGE